MNGLLTGVGFQPGKRGSNLGVSSIYILLIIKRQTNNRSRQYIVKLAVSATSVLLDFLKCKGGCKYGGAFWSTWGSSINQIEFRCFLKPKVHIASSNSWQLKTATIKLTIIQQILSGS